MHDHDMVQLEDAGPPGGPYQHEYEYEDEYEGEGYFELEDEFEDESHEAESELDEHTEVELASQFLEVSNDQQLEHFLGQLLSAVTGHASDFARSREGRQLGGILKQAAHRVLPAIAAARHAATTPGRTRDAAGRYRKAPHHESIASVGKRCFGLELEGVSHEDQEFAVARQFIRFAAKAIEDALAKQGTGPATQVAKQAVVAAAHKQAPGLITERMLDSPRVSRTSPAARRAGTVVPAQHDIEPHANHQPEPHANHQLAAHHGKAGHTPCPRCGLTGGARGGRWEIRGNAIVLRPY